MGVVVCDYRVLFNKGGVSLQYLNILLFLCLDANYSSMDYTVTNFLQPLYLFLLRIQDVCNKYGRQYAKVQNDTLVRIVF